MRNLTLVVLCSISLLSSINAQAAFKKNQIAKLSGVTCGFSRSWFPVKKAGKEYIKIKSPTRDQKAACSALVKPSGLNLSKLPNLTKLVASNAAGAASVTASAVSGTPPTLSEIVSTGPSTVFWAAGVVSSVGSGSPSPEQCQQFMPNGVDGSSGGFLSCYMTQSAGYSLAEIVRAGTTMCYLKNMPTREVLNAGGFRVISGSLPGGSVNNLFTTPSGTRPRVVKISLSAGGENGEATTGLLKIFSESQIASSGDLYRYEMAFCESNSGQPREKEKTRITSTGEFISSSSHSSDNNSQNSGTVHAFLRSEGGGLVFDTTRDRTAQFVSSRNEQGTPTAVKADITINGDNEITSKEFGIFGSDTRKAFSVSRFSGAGMSSLRFFEGAIRQTFSQGEFNGATEFRNTNYTLAPSNSYVSSVATVDLNTDGFYSGTPSPTDETLSVSCNTQPDIEIEVNMANDAIGAVTAVCEGERLDGVDFCRSSELQAAQSRFNSVCSSQ